MALSNDCTDPKTALQWQIVQLTSNFEHNNVCYFVYLDFSYCTIEHIHTAVCDQVEFFLKESDEKYWKFIKFNFYSQNKNKIIFDFCLTTSSLSIFLLLFAWDSSSPLSSLVFSLQKIKWNTVITSNSQNTNRNSQNVVICS